MGGEKKIKKWWTFIGPDWIHQFCFISAGAFYFNAVVSPTDPQVHLVGIVTNWAYNLKGGNFLYYKDLV